MTAERIHKFLANAGVGSRRQIEQWIIDGRVVVNGENASLGQKVSSRDRILVDGKEITAPEEHGPARVLAYHKPVGEICSRRDPQGRPTVFDNLPRLDSGRWIAVGRLDINTCGLMLFTNNGELANRLMHPSSEVHREYAVRVLGKVEPETLKRLRRGVELDDGYAKFNRIAEQGGEGANRWYRVVLTEGRQREVRRLWEAVDCKVSRLIRVRFGNIALERTLRPGTFEELKSGPVSDLYRLSGLTPPPAPDKPAHRTAKTPKTGEARRKKKRRLYRR